MSSGARSTTAHPGSAARPPCSSTSRRCREWPTNGPCRSWAGVCGLTPSTLPDTGIPIRLPTTGSRYPTTRPCCSRAADVLGLDTFAVAGVHTGASLALEVALQAEPGRATHAILSGVPLMTEEERLQYLASWSPPMQPTSEGEHLEWAWRRYRRIWGAETDPAVLHVGAIHVLSVLDRYEWAYNAAFRYDPEPGLRRLSCPTLLLDAEFDIFADQDEPAAALIPDARISIIPGLPGQLPIRVPEEYAERVARFVAG